MDSTTLRAVQQPLKDAYRDDPQAAILHNAFEKLRYPSYGRCLSVREWLDLVAGAGFSVRHHETLSKDLDLESWGGRMQAPPEAREKLRGILRDASGSLRDYLQPNGRPDNIDFVLREALIVAEPAGRLLRA